MGIQSVYPQADEEWIVVSTAVTINFDELIDHNLINSGTIVVYAAGDTIQTGPLPDIKINNLLDYEPNEYNIIKGTFDIYDYDDESGGDPYTRVVFTPNSPLHEFNTYTVVISHVLITGADTVYKWSFTTGNSDVQSLPVAGLPSGPTIVVGTTADVSSYSDLFHLSSSFPVDESMDVEVTTDAIVLDFNREVDETSVDASKFTLYGKTADGHRDDPSHGILPIDSVVVIGTRIYLYLTAGSS